MNISLIIATYNPNMEWLQTAIDSVPVGLINELILIDDCSGEPINFKPMLPIEWKGKNKLIRNRVNQGFWQSRNIGTEAAKGPWIATLDDDDIILPEGVEAAIKCYEHGRMFRPGIITFQLLQMNKDRSRVDTIGWPSQLQFTVGQLYMGNRLCSGSWYHKELWEVLNGFQYDEVEDWDLWLRASYIGTLALWSTSPVYLHRIYPESKWSKSCRHMDKILDEVHTRFQDFKIEARDIPRPFRPKE